MKTIYGLGPATRIQTGVRFTSTPVDIPPARRYTRSEIDAIRQRRRVALGKAQLALRPSPEPARVGLDPRVTAGILICYAIALGTCISLAF